jgi:hypothetical protein
MSEQFSAFSFRQNRRWAWYKDVKGQRLYNNNKGKGKGKREIERGKSNM